MVNFFCVRDTFPIGQNWKDTSRGPNGKPLKCSDENADCIYTEIKNGLEWASAIKMESTLQTSTEAATQVCMGLKFGGTGNWRLPFFKELVQAVQDGIIYLPFRESLFFNVFPTTFVNDAEDKEKVFSLFRFPNPTNDGLELSKLRNMLLVGEDSRYPMHKAGPTCVRDPQASTCAGDEDCDGVPDSEINARTRRKACRSGTRDKSFPTVAMPRPTPAVPRDKFRFGGKTNHE